MQPCARVSIPQMRMGRGRSGRIDMSKSSEQEDRKAERKKQEERARAVSAARKRHREEELRKLHLVATEVALLMGGKVRAAAAGNAWMVVDLSENHELTFSRDSDQINARRRVSRRTNDRHVTP